MTSGSTFEQFKKLNPPAFKGVFDPIVAESWVLDLENSLRCWTSLRHKKLCLLPLWLVARRNIGGGWRRDF